MLRAILTIIVVGWSVFAHGAPPSLERPAKLAFLGLFFGDLSTEGACNGARADETDRLVQEGFTVPSNAPISEMLSTVSNPARCYDCEVRLADRFGVRYVVVGQVRKAPNHVISISLKMRDVESGARVRTLAVDIRDNANTSWLHGLNSTLKTHFSNDEEFDALTASLVNGPPVPPAGHGVRPWSDTAKSNALDRRRRFA